ncbi:MAG: hypothetical protein COW01_08825 [Bdellovibrionales bacterium CG12_big_fil_rev_8_21_14_0_65_38_15]|nr:MAG: hypothetical protein COW79_16000 [Bdellovibrionales bacterium CG22_combo_CG10-13_8_21_14_all_38_13]PIQ54975.1 MAG: hypothetical protein COW01_08825 [Bdellovibrionales bacterium CG12_big_fil_rev_8_21_14_0_65_38_15]PIR30926.1 MAG: hypothetical protein COV38_02680 [Bdellovibrionales bacterium CG11_big_fil_rev_8_21_14_0_20_38_13]
MKVTFCHPHPLPVLKYGGSERILFWHMKELARQGHKVVLIGHPNSDVSRHGIALIPINEESWQSQIPTDTDIVHMFTNTEIPGTPTLITIQGNGKPGEVFSKNTVFLTKKHAAIHGSDVYVYNALDFDEYPWTKPSTPKAWDNFLFMAKGSWKVKNLKQCIKACKRSKKHLHIGGGKAILPSKYMHSYGMVGGDEKLSIMNKCDALLWPVRWHEPFGIAVIEAMALGLAVIASPYGSLPELVTKETGLIVNNYQELEAAVSQKHSFDAEVIRRYVEENFAITKLTQSYVELYKKVIAGESLNAKNPCWNQPFDSEHLLDF